MGLVVGTSALMNGCEEPQNGNYQDDPNKGTYMAAGGLALEGLGIPIGRDIFTAGLQTEVAKAGRSNAQQTVNVYNGQIRENSHNPRTPASYFYACEFDDCQGPERMFVKHQRILFRGFSNIPKRVIEFRLYHDNGSDKNLILRKVGGNNAGGYEWSCRFSEEGNYTAEWYFNGNLAGTTRIAVSD